MTTKPDDSNPTPNDNGNIIRTEKVRGYLYRVLSAAMPLLLLWGVVAENEIPLYIGLGAAVLGVPIAAANTSTKG